MLSNAGIAPDQYGLEIVLDLPNKSVMLPRVRSYEIPLGHALYIPVVGARSVTARARSTETSGTGTGDEGSAITLNTLDDTKLTMTKRFVYDGFYMGFETLNDLPEANRNAWFRAEQDQITMALGNDMDTQLLNLYSSAANGVGSGGADASLGQINEAIKLLRIANAPAPYTIVYPETQWDHLADIDALTRFDIRGEGSTIVNGQGFRLHGTDIVTSANVATSGGSAFGLAFSGEGIRVALRDQATVEQWRDSNTFTERVAIYSDFAYVNTFTDWIVQIETTDG